MTTNIYTTYYANIGNLPPNSIVISIAGKCPDWYDGLEYKKVAPKKDFFDIWKKNGDNAYYITNYYNKVLRKLNPRNVVFDIVDLAYRTRNKYHSEDTLNIFLVCYEKPNDFCHRHLLADWLNESGYEVFEWEV